MIRVLNIISDTNIGGAGRVILNYMPTAPNMKRWWPSPGEAC